MSKPLTIVLAAGGTGGHMFPAIAVGDALTARGHTVIAATDGRGQRFGAGIETENVTAGGIGGGVVGKIKGLCKIGLGAGQAQRGPERAPGSATGPGFWGTSRGGSRPRRRLSPFSNFLHFT